MSNPRPLRSTDLATWTGHVIVCGLHDEGLRIVEQLTLAGIPTIVVDDEPGARLVSSLDSLNVPYLAADARVPETLSAAGFAGAAALICVESDDLKTLATALLAHEIRPDARVVVQLRNPAVGRALTDIGVAVLDVAQLSAPSIVEGCLGSRRRTIRSWRYQEFVVAASLARASGSLREFMAIWRPSRSSTQAAPGSRSPRGGTTS